MHLTQTVINVGNFLWSSLHDFLYVGLYALLVKLRVVRPNASDEARLARLEAHLGLEPLEPSHRHPAGKLRKCCCKKILH